MNDPQDVLAGTDTRATVASEAVPFLVEWLPPLPACPDASADA
jgi:hypothetical protein